jgi:hypothetical protein
MASRRARPADVDEIAAALPETVKTTSWGDRPTWKVPHGDKGRGFVIWRGPRKDAVDPATGELYDDLLVIRTADAGDKQALVEAAGPFFTTDHFTGYNAVLVQESRLGEITRDELTEVITDAWLAVAPKKLAKAYLAGR